MPSRKIEQQLEKLSGLHAHVPDEPTLAALREALANPVNVVVAKAARIAGDLGTRSLLPELLSAFHRMFENPRHTDPQCWGKNALAKALKDLGHAGSQEFLRGLHHIQMEPVWGGQEDTATVLRGACALALAQCTDITRQDVMRHLIEAFTDETATVRADIARALEQMEGEEACLLLRLKALLGDKEPAVTGQILESLLRLEHAAAVPFVAKFLKAGGEVAEEAALALGASRLPAALEILKQTWTDARILVPEDVLLRAIGTSRHESAIEFLLNVVREGREREAMAALAALVLYRGSPEIRAPVAAAVESRNEPALHEEFRRGFSTESDFSS
ncbi:MAG TPA: hypothetical protein VHU83_03425 [Bryobacteraceae bacterium]|jgi:HEAT repeat protein|nr:hypothetical protein [Bryobacteraceae bacterium]